MAFSRIKPSGWAFGEIFRSSQANQLDVDHANAIDGVNGGTYDTSATTPLLFTTSGANSALTCTTSGATSAILAVSSGVAAALGVGNSHATTGALGVSNVGGGPAIDVGVGDINIADGYTVHVKGSTKWITVDSRTVTFAQPIADVVANTSSRFTLNAALMCWDQTNVTDAGALYVPVTNRPLKGSGTITAIMSVDGNGGGTGHGALPASADLPKIQILWVNSDGSLNSSTAGTDSSADVTAYHAVHNVTSSTVALTMTGAEAVYIKITGEQGANAAANALRIYRVWLTIPVTEITP